MVGLHQSEIQRIPPVMNFWRKKRCNVSRWLRRRNILYFYIVPIGTFSWLKMMAQEFMTTSSRMTRELLLCTHLQKRVLSPPSTKTWPAFASFYDDDIFRHFHHVQQHDIPCGEPRQVQSTCSMEVLNVFPVAKFFEPSHGMRISARVEKVDERLQTSLRQEVTEVCSANIILHCALVWLVVAFRVPPWDMKWWNSCPLKWAGR